jgi:hypothetical protein
MQMAKLGRKIAIVGGILNLPLPTPPSHGLPLDLHRRYCLDDRNL